jgi:hypothetical protein
MSIFHRRLLMTACLFFCACSKAPDATQSSAQTQHGETPQPLQRSELEDWARDATSASHTEAQHQQAAASHDASDALATPVIHTVD